jgi:hypothetical protein
VSAQGQALPVVVHFHGRQQAQVAEGAQLQVLLACAVEEIAGQQAADGLGAALAVAHRADRQQQRYALHQQQLAGLELRIAAVLQKAQALAAGEDVAAQAGDAARPLAADREHVEQVRRRPLFDHHLAAVVEQHHEVEVEVGQLPGVEVAPQEAAAVAFAEQQLVAAVPPGIAAQQAAGAVDMGEQQGMRLVRLGLQAQVVLLVEAAQQQALGEAVDGQQGQHQQGGEQREQAGAQGHDGIRP